MDRRAFLAASASAVSAAAPAARVRIGFLGSTHPHGPEKLRQMHESTEWELAGLAEKDAKAAAEAAAKGVRVVPRKQLLDDPSVRVIAVEGDVADHAADALDALNAGKHVHLEKAPTADIASFRKIVDLATRKNRIVQMGYMWRYNPAIAGAMEEAKRGTLGEIFMVRGTIHTAPFPQDVQSKVARFPGGQMFEMAGHLLDPMVRLLGKPVKVTPFLQKRDAAAPDNTVAVLEWPRALGVLLTSTYAVNNGAHRTFEVMGTKGNAVVRPIEPPTLLIEAGGAKSTPEMPPFKRYVEDFRQLLDAVRGGGKLRHYTLAEDLLVHETLLRAAGMMG